MADELGSMQDLDAYAQKERTYQYIGLEIARGIARIELNRPLNLLSVEMMGDVNQALESLEYQHEVKLIVFRASGQYFSAGFDMKESLGDRAYLQVEGFRRIFENLAKLDKPSLAVVARPTLGAGSILAVGCDMVLAAATVEFGFREIKAGLFNPVTVSLLPKLLGRKRAFEIILSGGSLAAADAEKLGLITRAVPDDKLDAEAAILVQRFQEGSAPVFLMTRRAIAGGVDLPFSEAVRQAEDVYLNQLMNTEDAAEGLKAIQEKRKPIWKDR